MLDINSGVKLFTYAPIQGPTGVLMNVVSGMVSTVWLHVITFSITRPVSHRLGKPLSHM